MMIDRLRHAATITQPPAPSDSFVGRYNARGWKIGALAIASFTCTK